MANRYPLQPGDVAPDYSDSSSSTEADRRPQQATVVRANPMSYHGDFPAADQSQPEGGRLWKVGQASPTRSAPWDVIQMDGDNNGIPAEVHEIDIYSYGDAYDPTSPMRIRQVAPAEAAWSFDSDMDGHRN